MRTSGVESSAYKIVVWGQPGTYKSTFFSHAPNPLFIDPNGGTDLLPVTRERVSSWKEVLDVVEEFESGKGTYDTLVFDEFGDIEEMFVAEFCRRGRKETLLDFNRGQGYYKLRAEFKLFLNRLTAIKNSGINVGIITHAEVKTVLNPDGPDYHRFVPTVDKGNWSQLYRWCQAALFFTKGVVAQKDKDGKVLAVSNQNDIVYCKYDALFDAKNRFNMPREIKNDEHMYRKFELFKEATENIDKMTEALREESVNTADMNKEEMATTYVGLKLKGIK